MDFSINVIDDESDGKNNKESFHPRGDPTDDNDNNVGDHGAQQMRINRNNNFYTLVENELQPSPQLEDYNETNDLKLQTNMKVN